MLYRGDVVEYVTTVSKYKILNGHVGVVTNSTPKYNNSSSPDEAFYAIQWISDYMSARTRIHNEPVCSGHWSETLLCKIGHTDLPPAD